MFWLSPDQGDQALFSIFWRSTYWPLFEKCFFSAFYNKLLLVIYVSSVGKKKPRWINQSLTPTRPSWLWELRCSSRFGIYYQGIFIEIVRSNSKIKIILVGLNGFDWYDFNAINWYELIYRNSFMILKNVYS